MDLFEVKGWSLILNSRLESIFFLLLWVLILLVRASQVVLIVPEADPIKYVCFIPLSTSFLECLRYDRRNG